MIKPPKPQLSPSQRIQRAAGELLKNGIDEAAKLGERTVGVLRDTDSRLGITERIQGSAADVDRLFHVSKKANSVSEAVRGAATAGKRMANEHGVTRLFTEHVAEPIHRTVNSVLSSEAARGMSSAGESIYGTTRQFVVNVFAPDLPTYDSHELLQATKRELNYIAACILQVSSEES